MPTPATNPREPHVLPEEHYRAPSQYTQCRRPNCDRPPVADFTRHNYRRHVNYWWAYCAEHLREYNKEVRDGRVWWLGTHVEDGVS